MNCSEKIFVLCCLNLIVTGEEPGVGFEFTQPTAAVCYLVMGCGWGCGLVLEVWRGEGASGGGGNLGVGKSSFIWSLGSL